MFFLFLAIICVSVITITIRFSESRISGKISMLAINYFTCMIIAGLDMGINNILPEVDGTVSALVLGIINGTFFTASLMFTQYNIKKNGIVLPSIFSRLGGLLIPLALSVWIFKEILKNTQVIGVLIAVVSIIIINYEKEHTVATSKLPLFILFLIDGCSTFMSKIFEETGNNSLSPQFLFYTFTTAFLCCLAVVLYKKEKPGKSEIFFGIILGLSNFFSAHFLLKALEEVPGVIVYPTYGVVGILILSLAGIFLFGERLKMKQWVTIGAILIAVVLLNI